ncbi:MAG: RNA polymerase sigma factor [Bacteroidales bacterium]
MSTSTVSDKELIQSYLSGNEASLATLIYRHQEKVSSYVHSQIRDRHLAEDIIQDTFLKVINTLKSGAYKEEGKFTQWLMRIAHNLVIDHFRRQKRFPMVENSEEFDIFERLWLKERSVEEQLIYEQIIRDAARLIHHLPDEQKEVVRMRLYEGLSFKEIADKTQVSINTALGRMRYALINLRRIIKQKDISLTM